MLSQFYHTLILSFFLLFSISSICSQDSFISSNPSLFNDLSQNGKDEFNNLIQDPNYSYVALIELSNIINQADDGKLEIVFPNLNCGEILFQTDELIYTDENNYTFSGTNQYQINGTCGNGQIYLQMSNSDLRGVATISNQTFTFKSIEGRYLIMQLSQNRNRGICGNGSILPSEGDFNLPYISQPIPYCPIEWRYSKDGFGS